MAKRKARRKKTSKTGIKYTLFLVVIIVLLGGFVLATQRISPEKKQVTISIQHEALTEQE